ncbi:MAG: hypothetical protein OZ921_10325 [Sorangiineae bacterium]|nr:hypothetical protein [Polyangiaceae bacterium]MEB2322902.1 hypothetical protein [Sorangiineae bacterium]
MTGKFALRVAVACSVAWLGCSAEPPSSGPGVADAGDDSTTSGRDGSTAADAALDGEGRPDGDIPDATVTDPCLDSSEEDPGLANAECYCEDYGLRRPEAVLEEGFDRSMVRTDVPFGSAFTTNQASRYRFEGPEWIGEAEGRAFLAGGARASVYASFMGRPRMKGAYLAIPFFVPKSAPDMTFRLTYTPDGQSFSYPSMGISFTTSPCVGDFRARSEAQQRASTDPEYAYFEGGFTFGVADDPAAADREAWGVGAILRKGRVFYLNVSEHLWLSGGEYRCPDEEPIDETAFDATQVDRLRNFGCGGLVVLQRSAPPTSP